MNALIRPCILVISIFILPTIARAQEMSGSSYNIENSLTCLAGPGASSSTYELENIMGVNGIWAMSGSIYGLNPGFYNLNSLPVATIANYNDSRPTDDETPTLQWLYSDVDNDTQKRYQLQVGHEGFESPVVDTGMVSSSATSFTTSILPGTEERTLYKWRIRVDDGFGWSGWTLADSGFILAKGEFFITGLAALTAPGGAEIGPSSWQSDNDPYFYWESPASGLEVLGYSYALDVLPDDEIDANNIYYYFDPDSIDDGTHTFYVKAKRSSGLWGEPASFSLWVDTTAPTMSSLTPTLGGVISTDTPQVKASLSDVASGINPDTIEMRINQALVDLEYNPESGRVFYTPSIPFSDGEIIVSLEATDSVGNYSSPLTWSFVVDTAGPTGSMLINNGDEMTNINIVTLNISAGDDLTDVAEIMLSNDGVFDTESWEPYTSLRKNWALPVINGMRKVYAKVRDEAGNISDAFFDEINLLIVAPETYILSGPSGISQVQDAQFTFRASLDGCQFSYKFDDADWSEWVTSVSAEQLSLAEGNHYFMVRAAKDLNQDGLLQLDEVDPTAALRVWTISLTGALKPPSEPEKPIIHWEEE